MNRKISRSVFSLLLCLSILVGMATTAFAAGTEMITVRVLYLTYNETEHLNEITTNRQNFADYTSHLDSFSVTIQSQTGKSMEFSEFPTYKLSEVCTASYFPYMSDFDAIEAIYSDVLSGNKYTIAFVPIPTGYELSQSEVKAVQGYSTSQIDILALLSPVGKTSPQEPEKPVVVVEQPSAWATEQVNAAIASNIVPTQLQNKYTQATTRAEFCALGVALYESVMGEIKERNTFSDTNDINVEKMAAIGIVSGVGNNKFSPNAELTREQAATMLSRLASAVGKPLAKQMPTFSDNSSIASWALESVGQIQAAGIMSGVGNNTFAPQSPYTREQSIITIMRLYTHLGSNSVEQPTDTQYREMHMDFPTIPRIENINSTIKMLSSSVWDRSDDLLPEIIYSYYFSYESTRQRAEQISSDYSTYLQGLNWRLLDASVYSNGFMKYNLSAPDNKVRLEIYSTQDEEGQDYYNVIHVVTYPNNSPVKMYRPLMPNPSVPDFGEFFGVALYTSDGLTHLYSASNVTPEMIVAYGLLLKEFGFTSEDGISGGKTTYTNSNNTKVTTMFTTTPYSGDNFVVGISNP